MQRIGALEEELAESMKEKETLRTLSDERKKKYMEDNARLEKARLPFFFFTSPELFIVDLSLGCSPSLLSLALRGFQEAARGPDEQPQGDLEEGEARNRHRCRGPGPLNIPSFLPSFLLSLVPS